MNHQSVTRIQELEDVLECKILKEVTKGESLEKYHAILEGEEILLRIYNDTYYSNRFLREGMVLRQLQETVDVVTPQIVDEWPELQIRAIEWYTFEDREFGEEDYPTILSWLQDQDVELPFSLQEDLIPHLLQTQGIHQGYKSFFENKLDAVLDTIDWEAGDHGLVHGDFHKENVGYLHDRIVIYDWEYATLGSSWYDQAYFHILHSNHDRTDIPIPWLRLVALVNTHWYLQEEQFSPKEAIFWVDKLGELF